MMCVVMADSFPVPNQDPSSRVSGIFAQSRMSYATTLEPAAAAARFRHQPPSVAMQWMMALGMNGVMRPLVRTLEATGRADRFLSAMAAQGRRRAQENPFVPTRQPEHDVIVMTFPKSGTNWMMQIAHQLIHHGRGEYDHIHDIVPWPDIETMPGFMRRYAIPLAQRTGNRRRNETRHQDALQLGFDSILPSALHRDHP